MSGMSMELDSVMISDRLSKEMVNVAKDLALRAVAQCALHYNFDGDEAIRLLGLSNVKASEVREEVREEKVSKGSCPLPYSGELVESNCHALRKADFLFTQCKSERKDGSMFCAKCEKISEKTDGVPPYGTIEMRRACDILEYVAPNGEKPKAFVKIMRYYKTTREEVEREASRLNVVIDERHFEDIAPVSRRGRPPLNKEKAVKGPQGRPKKSKKVLEVEQPADLFDEYEKKFGLEKLVPDEISVTELDSAVRWLEDTVSSPVPKVDVEEAIVKAIVEKCDPENGAKEPEKATKESENAAKAAEKAERRAAKHAENEAKRAAKAAKHAENEAKRAVKAAKRAAKEEVKETAKETATETAKEEVKETAKEEVKETAKEEVKETATEEVKETATEEVKKEEVVVRITYEGKKYLKSKASGVIYDLEKYVNTQVQVVVGQWDEKNDKIKFSACEESEEEEEEYDESDDEEVDDEEVDDE